MVMDQLLPEQLLTRINAELGSRPLVAIDLLLEAFSIHKEGGVSVEDTGLLDLFCRAVLKAENVNEAQWLRDPKSALFDKNLTRKNHRFISVCLLRLLTCNQEPFQAQFGSEVIRLFDRTFSTNPLNLYDGFHIDITKPKHEKQKLLVEILPAIESELTVLLSSLKSLEAIGSFQTSFMDQLKVDYSKEILWPFLPKELLEVRLNEIFITIDQYLRESGAKMLQSYDRAKQVLSTFLFEAENFRTKYSREYLGAFGTTILGLLQNHVESSPISNPAQLTVIKSEKKYPLHETNKRFELSFVLENKGPGHAFDVFFTIEVKDLKLERAEIYLGHLDPTSVVVNVPATVQNIAPSNVAYIKIKWTNFDKTSHEEEELFDLEGQPSHVDWETLSIKEPYSLEAVENANQLIGRKELIAQLFAQASAESIGCSYISGQKRVGKTSIAKALRSRIEATYKSDYQVIYFERGDYLSASALTTVLNLGRRICQAVKDADKQFAGLVIPQFEDGLSPLTEFLDNVLQIAPNYRILFILDEFDELPVELYKREPVGDAFFATLRSISGKPPFGIILVGAENMEFIMALQGHALNKFQSIQVNYFDREEHWSDFAELVRRPVAEHLEITDGALVALYEQSAGNPFFTKLICARLFKNMVNRRDSHVTESEVAAATKRALRGDIAANKVQHFWTDGIFESGIRHEETSIRRRKVLLCLADVYRHHGEADRKTIVKEAEETYDLDPVSVEHDLRDFRRRQILIEKEDHYYFKVNLFRDWLKESGIHDIITTFSDSDEWLTQKKLDEGIRIKSEDITRLVDQWGVYLGQRISEEQVRRWLEQFGDFGDQRLMFEILRHVRFYTADNIRAKMRDAHGIVVRGLIHRIEREKRKRSDVLISYLDSFGKSGAYYAKLYADENDIYVANIIEPAKLVTAAAARPDTQVIVFIDDFIGTGSQACENFRKLNAKHGDFLRNLDVRMYFVSISGFATAQKNVIKVLEELDLPISVHLCDPLDESAKCFSEESKVFSSPADRLKAKEIVDRYSLRLGSSFPQDYGQRQGAVVFENSCPNTTLPILWSESINWVPIFKRL